ncbi:MAG: septal ring lytic transglycosylase RlpA family protein [Bacteroidales bacterium]|jgi:rare lipoprotein A|nr:septal ring lytic transglycosylase RlpA family protein [Bacteroidales bacterium]
MVEIRKIIFILLLICFGNIGQKSFAQTQKEFECKATYYHNMFENRKTSSGEIFSQKKYTAAHKTIPLHTYVKVTNLSNGLSVIVKVNDRCPKRGIIDLSYIAAKEIMLHKTGVAKVKVEIIDKNYKEEPQKQDIIENKIEEKQEIVQVIDTINSQQTEIISDIIDNNDENPSPFLFFVRISSIEHIEDLDMIKGQLPIEYKNIVLAEKVFNQEYYYVNVGPFLSINLAEQALNTLKSTYKSAYIVKKK